MAMPALKNDQLKSGAEVQGKLAKAAVPSPEKAPVFAGAREVDELHSFFGNKFHISDMSKFVQAFVRFNAKK